MPDFVALRYNRFLQRYELTSLVWDVANQEFVQRTEDVAAVVTAEGDAAVGGKLTRDARFTLVYCDDRRSNIEVTVAAADTNTNEGPEDLAADVQAAIDAALGGGPIPAAWFVSIWRAFDCGWCARAIGPGIALEIRPDAELLATARRRRWRPTSWDSPRCSGARARCRCSNSTLPTTRCATSRAP